MRKSVKNLIWLILLVALSLLTFRVVIGSSSDFTFSEFSDMVKGMNQIWLVLALLASFGFLYFEGLGLKCTCRFFGHPIKTTDAVLYSSTDFYFSAITPTAAGGQPAALLIMSGRDVPAAISAMALLLNLIMYTTSLLFIGIVFFILNPSLFLGLDTFCRICIVVGAIFQSFLIWLFYMSMFKDKAVLRVCTWLLNLLCRLHILRNRSEKQEKLYSSVAQYKHCGEQLRSEKKLPRRVFACNLAQRMCVILIPVFIFLGMGGSPSNIIQAMSAQSLALVGSNAMPIPGAVGISDFLFLNGFETLIDDPVSLDILSRGFSFFLPLIFSGIILFIEIITRNMRQNNKPPRIGNFVFNKKAGKPFKWMVTNPYASLLMGKFMDTGASKVLIKRFIASNNIDLDDYIAERYHCFNDFFTRRIKPELRPVDTDENSLISPCDGMLSAYRLSPECKFSVKNTLYAVRELLRDPDLARRYENGLCLVLRLGVHNYHRYCYLDNGTKTENRFIKGRYNPVMPLVSLNNPVYRQNSREFCTLHTENFGDIVQIEVGACMVGRIVNHHDAGPIRRGQEKGLFQYGGSTIVLLLEKDAVKLAEEVFERTKQFIETPILYGAKIAEKLNKVN